MANEMYIFGEFSAHKYMQHCNPTSFELEQLHITCPCSLYLNSGHVEVLTLLPYM